MKAQDKPKKSGKTSSDDINDKHKVDKESRLYIDRAEASVHCIQQADGQLAKELGEVMNRTIEIQKPFLYNPCVDADEFIKELFANTTNVRCKKNKYYCTKYFTPFLRHLFEISKRHELLDYVVVSNQLWCGKWIFWKRVTNWLMGTFKPSRIAKSGSQTIPIVFDSCFNERRKNEFIMALRRYVKESCDEMEIRTSELVTRDHFVMLSTMLSERYKQKCVLRPNKEPFEASSIPLLSWIDNHGNGNKNTWNMCWPDTTSCPFSSNAFVAENCTTDTVLSKDREIAALRDQIAWFQLENTRLKYVNEEMSRHYCQLYQSYLTTQQQQPNNGTLLPKCTIENFETLQLLTKENAELKQQVQQSSKRIEEIRLQCTPPLVDNLHDKQAPKRPWDEKSEVPQADWMDLDLPLTHSVANEPENSFGDFVNAYGEKNFDLMFDMEN